MPKIRKAVPLRSQGVRSAAATRAIFPASSSNFPKRDTRDCAGAARFWIPGPSQRRLAPARQGGGGGLFALAFPLPAKSAPSSLLPQLPKPASQKGIALLLCAQCAPALQSARRARSIQGASPTQLCSEPPLPGERWLLGGGAGGEGSGEGLPSLARSLAARGGVLATR